METRYMKTLHTFTATIRLHPDAPDMDHKSGPGWTITFKSKGRTANVTFKAETGLDAVGHLHFVVQRHARSIKDQANPRLARKRYSPKDHTVISLAHPGTGDYELPRGENPDMSVAGRRRIVDLATPKYQDVKFDKIIETCPLCIDV